MEKVPANLPWETQVEMAKGQRDKAANLQQPAPVQPGYQQQDFPYDPSRPIDLMVTPTGEGGTVSIGQDVRIFRVRFDAAGEAQQTLPGGRAAWVQIVRGTLRVNGDVLSEGDGLAIATEAEARAFQLAGDAGSEALWLELPEVRHA